MYHRGCTLLESQGYKQYEISNFAKEGRACRQNLAYWRRRPYLGFGLGAASFEFESRYVNPRDFEIYHQRVRAGETVREMVESMDQKAALAETMILGLRLKSGLSMGRLERKFPEEFPKIQSIIQEQVDKGLLIRTHGRIYLSDQGLDLANQVMMEFMD
jgi:oxygen-independent coproporphyrinogen-3 oxidase